MAKMPWFPLYAADFMTDTATWSDEEIGAYFRLLCHQWINGALPLQHERLARLVSASPERLADLWLVLGPKFHDLGNGRLQNARLERERRAQATQSQARTERARKAAAARWGDDDDTRDTDSCSGHSGEQCSSIACQSQSQIQNQKSESQSESRERLPSVAACPETPDAGRSRPEPPVTEWIPIKGSLPKTLSHGPVRTGASGPEYGVTEDRVREWEDLYPAVNVRQVLRSIRGWNLSHPRNRKTYPKGGGSGIVAHIDTWLRRDQDRAGVTTNGRPAAAPEPIGPPPDHWTRLSAALRERLGTEYRNLFGEVTVARQEHERLVLGVPDLWLVEKLEEKVRPVIDAVVATMPTSFEVLFQVDNPDRRTPEVKT